MDHGDRDGRPCECGTMECREVRRHGHVADDCDQSGTHVYRGCGGKTTLGMARGYGHFMSHLHLPLFQFTSTSSSKLFMEEYVLNTVAPGV